jgi:GNAT superfamily N-acetyltransferase
MAEPGSVTYRRATDGDVRAAFDVFRHSLIEYLHRLRIVDSPVATEAMNEGAWAIRRPWIEHLWRTSAENWVAEDPDGHIVGWAMSVERSGHLELTHFFVVPGAQSKGVGRGLLELAFPADGGRHRTILATQDPRAMSRYLRSGVRFITSVIDFTGPPRAAPVPADLEFERLSSSAASVEQIALIEAQVIGHRRDVDTAFILKERPAWLARRGGEVIGFAFGAHDELAGPMAALNPADIPALLAFVETVAAEAGEPSIDFSVPMANSIAVRHLLERGLHIDPFVAMLLADDDSMLLDRWVHTALSYIL